MADRKSNVGESTIFVYFQPNRKRITFLGLTRRPDQENIYFYWAWINIQRKNQHDSFSIITSVNKPIYRFRGRRNPQQIILFSVREKVGRSELRIAKVACLLLLSFPLP